MRAQNAYGRQSHRGASQRFRRVKDVTRTIFFVLGVLAACAAPVAAATDTSVAHFTLANGLEVVVVPDHRAPVVTHMIWY
jgi:hypothetical protein